MVTPNSHASSLAVVCPLTDKMLMISALRCAMSIQFPLSLIAQKPFGTVSPKSTQTFQKSLCAL